MAKLYGPFIVDFNKCSDAAFWNGFRSHYSRYLFAVGFFEGRQILQCFEFWILPGCVRSIFRATCDVKLEPAYKTACDTEILNQTKTWPQKLSMPYINAGFTPHCRSMMTRWSVNQISGPYTVCHQETGRVRTWHIHNVFLWLQVPSAMCLIFLSLRNFRRYAVITNEIPEPPTSEFRETVMFERFYVMTFSIMSCGGCRTPWTTQ